MQTAKSCLIFEAMLTYESAAHFLFPNTNVLRLSKQNLLEDLPYWTNLRFFKLICFTLVQRYPF